jgi:hypothetical protein
LLTLRSPDQRATILSFTATFYGSAASRRRFIKAFLHCAHYIQQSSLGFGAAFSCASLVAFGVFGVQFRFIL